MIIDKLVNQMKVELDWVIKVTKSSETSQQLNTAHICYNLWLKKYDHYSNDRFYSYLLSYWKSYYWSMRKTKESVLS
jgi:hypothetical protein